MLVRLHVAIVYVGHSYSTDSRYVGGRNCKKLNNCSVLIVGKALTRVCCADCSVMHSPQYPGGYWARVQAPI